MSVEFWIKILFKKNINVKQIKHFTQLWCFISQQTAYRGGRFISYIFKDCFTILLYWVLLSVM